MNKILKLKYIIRILNNTKKKSSTIERLTKEELNKVLELSKIDKHRVKFFVNNKSVRFCNVCNKFTIFSYNKLFLHSKCEECGCRHIPSIYGCD